MDLETFLLSELDRAKLNGVNAGDRLKKLFQRGRIELDAAEDAADNMFEQEVEAETVNKHND